MVSAWTIKIKEIKGSEVIGYTHRFWHEVKHLGLPYLKTQLLGSVSNKKMELMKDSDVVWLRFNTHSKNLLTKEELRMAMIKWIANDFEDPTDRGEDY